MIGRPFWGSVGWNIGGALLPLVVAIATMPILIRQLGDERFGILAIGWVVTTYFVLSDFGVGVATKKFMASTLAGDTEDASSLIWTSLTIHALLGAAGAFALAVATPWLLEVVFSVPIQLLPESNRAFFWLAASILPLLLTSFLRNLLEARHRFDLANILRIPASTINYLIPLALLQASESLDTLLAGVLVGRLLVLGAHVVTVINAIPEIRKPKMVSILWVKQLCSFGGWVTVSSLVGTAVLISDRMLVVSLFGLSSVTYYVTPYEVVTKLWIISASLLGAMFPAIAASRHGSTDLRRTYRDTSLILGLISAPLVSLLIVFSRDLLGWWIGPVMAAEGGTVAKWIALGTYFSILSQLPLTVLQATGKPEIVTKIQLLLLPFFIAFAFELSRIFGSVGIAMAWCARQFVELGLLHIQAARQDNCSLMVGKGIVPQLLIATPVFMFCCWLIERTYREETGLKVVVFILFGAFYLIASSILLRESGIKLALTSLFRKLRGNS